MKVEIRYGNSDFDIFENVSHINHIDHILTLTKISLGKDGSTIYTHTIASMETKDIEVYVNERRIIWVLYSTKKGTNTQ